MGLIRDFFTGRLHVYYGLIFLFALSILEIVYDHDFMWLFVLVIATGILVDLYVHRYSHLPFPRHNP
jgi:hypothetical protein